MPRYAANTTTSAAYSQQEIQKVLTRWGATHTMVGSGPDGDVIGFQLRGRQYRFSIRKPDDAAALEAWLDSGGTAGGYRGLKPGDGIAKEWRRRWRTAVLWLKATLEFAGGDDEALQKALLGSMALPDGRTFSQWARPQIDAMYDRGEMPPLLGSGVDE